MSELPKTRKEAKQCGSVFYEGGKPCKHGHGFLKYTRCGGCVKCFKERPRPGYKLRSVNSANVTKDLLDGLFCYDKESGALTRKIPAGKFPAGSRAGGVFPVGYRYVAVNGVPLLEHRVIFFLVEGRWPRGIDHINRKRDDNRWCNLRECTPKQNSANTTQRSGRFKGVTLDRKSGKWKAQATCKGKNTSLGTFFSEEDAAKAFNSFCLASPDREFCFLNEV